MLQRSGFWVKCVGLFVILVLIVPILMACGDDDEDEETPMGTTPVATTPATPAATTPTAKPPDSEEPVKIGIVMSWSGSMGLAGLLASEVISVVEDQVEEMGGVLGRPLEIITYDDESTVSGTLSGWKKLVTADNVALITYGGASGANTTASAEASSEYEVPYFSFSPSPDDLSDYPYTVRTTYTETTAAETCAQFTLNNLMPIETVAFLGDQDPADHNIVAILKDILEPAGIDMVYDEYVPFDVTDMSPYLSRIQYHNPDLLIEHHAPLGTYIATFKQITDLGSWGDIKYLAASPASSAAFNQASAKGTYHWALWDASLPYPASKKFVEDFTKKHGKPPIQTQVFFYQDLWVPIKAIELAGSDDPQDIAEVMRSGELKWDSPCGPLVIGTDGQTNLKGHILQIGEDGMTQVVWSPEVE